MPSIDDLLENYRKAANGDASAVAFDRATLQSACLDVAPEAKVCSDASFGTLLRYLLAGPAAASAPDSFSSSTDEENQPTVAAEVAVAVCSSSPAPPEQDEFLAVLQAFESKTDRRPPGLAAMAVLLGKAVSQTPYCDADEREPVFDVQELFVLLFHGATAWLPNESSWKSYGDATAQMMTLLLQYHDPALSLHFDQQHVSIGRFVLSWVVSMFLPRLIAVSGDSDPISKVLEDAAPVADAPLPDAAAVSEALSLLTWLAVVDQRELVPYLALAAIMDQRAYLTRVSGKGPMHQALRSMRFIAGGSSAKELVLKAKLLLKRTPTCARQTLTQMLQGSPGPSTPTLPGAPTTLDDPEEMFKKLNGSVVLPVTAAELAAAFAVHEPGALRPPTLSYVVLDCRAESSFKYARLPTALLVGDQIGFDPEIMAEMLGRVETVRGSHLVVLGTGKNINEEANLLKFIALQLLQRGFSHVSVAEGGFKACVPFIKVGKMEYARSNVASPAKQTATATTEASEATKKQEEEQHANREAAEAKLRAAAEAAKTGMAAAKRWGFGFAKTIADKAQALNATRRTSGTDGTETAQAPQAANANAEASTKPERDESSATTSLAGSPSSRDRWGAPSPEPSRPASSGASSASAAVAKRTPSPAAATTTGPSGGTEPQFTLADGDDDDDFDLITDLGPKAVEAKQPEEEATPAAAATKATHVDPTAPEAAPADATDSGEKTTSVDNTATEEEEPKESTSAPAAASTEPSKTEEVPEEKEKKEADEKATPAKPATTAAAPAATTPHPFDSIFDDDD